jgi:hypothetical protein
MDWDPARVELFTTIARDLPRAIRTLDVLETLPAAGDEPQSNLPFYEAYFSKFIEGTEFTIDEAERIVNSGVIPADRPEEAHDILGTYRLMADADVRAYVAHAPDQFLDNSADGMPTSWRDVPRSDRACGRRSRIRRARTRS